MPLLISWHTIKLDAPLMQLYSLSCSRWMRDTEHQTPRGHITERRNSDGVPRRLVSWKMNCFSNSGMPNAPRPNQRNRVFSNGQLYLPLFIYLDMFSFTNSSKLVKNSDSLMLASTTAKFTVSPMQTSNSISIRYFFRSIYHCLYLGLIMSSVFKLNFFSLVTTCGD